MLRRQPAQRVLVGREAHQLGHLGEHVEGPGVARVLELRVALGASSLRWMLSTNPPPSMPTFWAETPTQAWPCAVRCRWKKPQSGAASMPAETLCHSTTTVPLKRAGSIGSAHDDAGAKRCLGPGPHIPLAVGAALALELVGLRRARDGVLRLLVAQRGQVVVPHDVRCRPGHDFERRCVHGSLLSRRVLLHRSRVAVGRAGRRTI